MKIDSGVYEDRFTKGLVYSVDEDGSVTVMDAPEGQQWLKGMVIEPGKVREALEASLRDQKPFISGFMGQKAEGSRFTQKYDLDSEDSDLDMALQYAEAREKNRDTAPAESDAGEDSDLKMANQYAEATSAFSDWAKSNGLGRYVTGQPQAAQPPPAASYRENPDEAINDMARQMLDKERRVVTEPEGPAWMSVVGGQ